MFKLFLFLSLIGNTAVEGDSLRLIKHVPVKSDFFTTDNLGNFYCSKKDVISKYYLLGDSISKQSIKRLGQISAIDASNSLRILLFYKDLNQLAVLDNTLSLQGEVIKLEKIGYSFVTLVCQSPFNQNIILYDTEGFKLVRLNNNFQVLNESGNLSQILRSEINPNFLIENGEHIYLNDPENGIYVFDMFGTYFKTIPITHLDRFQVIGGDIYFMRENKLCKYSQLSLTTSQFSVDFSGVLQFRIEKNILYLRYSDKISLFSIQ